MNLGSGGMSWNVGPRGASVGIGKRGTYLNAGLPGTGLSSRTRLDSPRSAATASPAAVHVQVTVELTDEGQLFFMDQNGNQVSAEIERQTKLQQPEQIRELIRNKCSTLNAQIDALRTLHVHTPIPNVQPKFNRIQYDEFEPAPPVAQEYGLMAKLGKRFAERIDEENAKRQSEYHLAMEVYSRNKAAHDAAQTALKQDFFSAIAGVPESMERLLERELGDIVWPRETVVSLDISPEGDRVFLDVDLPEIEHMPQAVASLPPTGFQMSVKRMSDTEHRKLYMQHIHAIGFRLMGEVFAVLPSVLHTTVSGYSQRGDPTTGHIADEYLYSVRATRDQWGAVNFNRLEAIDVVEALGVFDMRRTVSKTGVFKAIDPF